LDHQGGNQGGSWKADEVGYFFPDLHRDYGTAEIVTIGRDSYYCNVQTFLQRLDDVTRLRGADVVRNNISTCLRGAALQWYMSELTDEEKQSLRAASTRHTDDPLYRWRGHLRRRWDPPPAVAQQNFMNSKFTMQMARSGISVLDYYSTKIRLAKEAGFTRTYQQLLAVWNGLDVEIRELVEEPEEFTTMDRFRKKLEDKERL
jgi:hypothetical protein